ncbi:MAG: iron chelate uptake ABC transporter family permease subunit, partial [Cellulomonadaceae bacterium]|nr:iron chelate uptake ABC transporter family permease subunit [Cellulomonadaceae bacterium]
VAFVSGPIARRLRGRGQALGTAALVGALVVVGADLAAQHLVPGSLQPPVGLVTGALGAPFLLWLLVHGERRKELAA